MQTIYARAILYAYPNLTKNMDNLDRSIMKKALNSINDSSSCIEQCEHIMVLKLQREILFDLKDVMDSVFAQLSEDENEILKGRYFTTSSKMANVELMFSYPNAYYRAHDRCINKIINYLKLSGITEETFKTGYLEEYIKPYLRKAEKRKSPSKKNEVNKK